MREAFGFGVPVTRRDLLRRAIATAGAFTMAGSAGALTGCGKADPHELNLYIWTSFVPESVLSDFERETGIHVNLAMYSSDEELLAKVRTENPGTYDVVQPDPYMVESLIAQDRLMELDLDRLKNLGNMDASYLDQRFDPKNEHTVPYMGSVTVIGVNSEKVDKDSVKGYGDLLDERFRSNLVSLNDMRGILCDIACSVGLTGNETKRADIEKIGKAAQRFKPQIKVYDSDSPKSALISGDCEAGLLWAAEIALAQDSGAPIDVVFPQEGFSKSVASWAIPKGTPRYDNAMKFIDYMLRPDVAAKCSEAFPYVQPNTAAMKLLPESVRDNPAKNVPADVMGRGIDTRNLDPSVLKLYDRVWTDLKA